MIRKHNSKHNHAPEASRIRVIKVLNDLETSAKHSNEKSGTIVRDAILNADKNMQPYLLSTDALRQKILYMRKKIGLKSQETLKS